MDGVYIQNTDYAEPRTRATLLAEVEAMVEEFRDVPGVLMWLLGNENNYGLFWGGAATEDIPEGETLESVRARHMYSLFNDAIKTIKASDTNRPVAMCNGDLLFIDVIAEEINELDVFGTNMYRGISFGDAFKQVKEKLGVPIMFTDPKEAPAVFKIKLVDFGADGAFGGGDDGEHELTLTESSSPALATGAWVGLDIPLSEFTGLTKKGHLAQLIISGDLNTVYLDNVLLHR